MTSDSNPADPAVRDTTTSPGSPKVSFEDRWKYASFATISQEPPLLRWIVTHSGGVVRSTKHASYVALGFVVLVIVLSLVLILKDDTAGPIHEDYMQTPQFLPQPFL